MGLRVCLKGGVNLVFLGLVKVWSVCLVVLNGAYKEFRGYKHYKAVKPYNRRFGVIVFIVGLGCAVGGKWWYIIGLLGGFYNIECIIVFLDK